MSKSSLNIAVIPGDGIGKEVVPEGIRVLEVAGSRYGIDFNFDEFPWSCEDYKTSGAYDARGWVGSHPQPRLDISRSSWFSGGP